MNALPKIGIVVVNWNGVNLTTECLHSLYKLRYNDYCIVVVDNGSTDDSIDVLKEEFPGLCLIPLQENTGFVGGYNIGINECLSRACSYILLLNNDTIVDDKLLEEMIKVFEGYPHAGVLNPKIYYYERPERIQSMGMNFSLWSGVSGLRRCKMKDKSTLNKIEEVPSASGCALMVKREVFDKIGVLDEIYFAYAEDLDYCLRAKKAGFKIMCAPHAKVWHKEEYSWKKNKAQLLRYYLSSRNGLLLLYRHGNWYHWVTYILNYYLRFVMKLFILSIMRQDYRSSLALLEGNLSFIRLLFGSNDWIQREKNKIYKLTMKSVSMYQPVQ